MSTTPVAEPKSEAVDNHNPEFEEAVATLSAILNHEICKPLSTILSNAQILRQTLPTDDPEMHQRLEAIEAAARTIKQCARDIAAESSAAHDMVDC